MCVTLSHCGHQGGVAKIFIIIIADFETFFYVARHLDSTAPYLPVRHLDSTAPYLPVRHLDSTAPYLPTGLLLECV
jgi:hypothetical protein